MKKFELRTITKIETTSDFHLICTFDNQIIKTFNMQPFLRKKGSMIEPLKKISFFRKVFIEMGCPTWPNGFDICADLIYQKGIKLKLAA